LQTVLKRLGYYDTRIDGKFGRGTKRAVQVFQFDADLEPTGVVNSTTAEQLSALLLDYNRWVIPQRDEVDAPQDQMALFIDIMAAKGIPLAFATALAEQEGNLDHFDSDGFVKPESDKRFCHLLQHHYRLITLFPF
jgi:peptidoglycan hydrolase-like protein with peptidoglycan-binding domain